MSENDFLTDLSVINYISMPSVGRLRKTLQENQFRLLELDGADINDAAAFQAESSTQLLGGEPVYNWDSYADTMGNYIASMEPDPIALIWTNVQNMLNGYLRDLITAVDILTGISRSRYAHHHSFVTFLAGNGPNFQ